LRSPQGNSGRYFPLDGEPGQHREAMTDDAALPRRRNGA